MLSFKVQDMKLDIILKKVFLVDIFFVNALMQMYRVKVEKTAGDGQKKGV